MQTDNRLFIHHPDPAMLASVGRIIDSCKPTRPSTTESEIKELQARAERAANELAEDGHARFAAFQETLEKNCGEHFEVHHCKSHGNWLEYEFTGGGLAYEILAEACRFFVELVPGLEARGWGCGDDDPWEYWIRCQHQRWWTVYDGPSLVCESGAEDLDEDEELTLEDEGILARIMPWWHHGLPTDFRVGLLSAIYERDAELERLRFDDIEQDSDQSVLRLERVAPATVVEEMFIEDRVVSDADSKPLSSQDYSATIASLNAVAFRRARHDGRVGVLRGTIGAAFWSTISAVFNLFAAA